MSAKENDELEQLRAYKPVAVAIMRDNQSLQLERAELLDALEATAAIARELTKNEVCDHDAGICWCGEKAIVRDALDLLAVYGRGRG